VQHSTLHTAVHNLGFMRVKLRLIRMRQSLPQARKGPGAGALSWDDAVQVALQSKTDPRRVRLTRMRLAALRVALAQRTAASDATDSSRTTQYSATRVRVGKTPVVVSPGMGESVRKLCHCPRGVVPSRGLSPGSHPTPKMTRHPKRGAQTSTSEPERDTGRGKWGVCA